MSPAVISITTVAYFIILFTISYIAGRKADNEGFFVGNRKSAWYIVAFAMIGSTISGVTFVYKSREFIIDMYTLTYFLFPVCLRSRVWTNASFY